MILIIVTVTIYILLLLWSVKGAINNTDSSTAIVKSKAGASLHSFEAMKKNQENNKNIHYVYSEASSQALAQAITAPIRKAVNYQQVTRQILNPAPLPVPLPSNFQRFHSFDVGKNNSVDEPDEQESPKDSLRAVAKSLVQIMLSTIDSHYHTNYVITMIDNRCVDALPEDNHRMFLEECKENLISLRETTIGHPVDEILQTAKLFQLYIKKLIKDDIIVLDDDYGSDDKPSDCSLEDYLNNIKIMQKRLQELEMELEEK